MENQNTGGATLNAKHTGGEWVVSHGANRTPSIGSAVLHQPIAHVCAIGELNPFCQEAEANARLIAAAPELLQMLEMASLYLSKAVADNELQGCAVPVENALKAINATIDKARGA